MRYGRPQGHPILDNKMKVTIEYPPAPNRYDHMRQYAQARLAQDAVEAYQKAIVKHRATFGKQGPVQISAEKPRKSRNRGDDPR